MELDIASPIDILPGCAVPADQCSDLLMEHDGVHELLCRTLFPKLQLASLQALRCTSTTLRVSVDSLPSNAWKIIARYGHS